MGRYKLYIHYTRLAAVLLVLILLMSIVPTAFADGETGQCGDNLTWTLSAGTLTVSGSGDMWDFTEPGMAPWYPLRGEILRLVLPEGLTSVGDLAFYQCTKLETVSLPSSVQSVGNYAFMDCSGMKVLNLGSGLTSVGDSAFANCYELRSLSLPSSLNYIGMKAFYRCESITSVVIPAGVTHIGVSAFGYCKKLVSATVNASISEIPEFMFYGCGMLTSVTLPPQVETVNEFSFRGCDELYSVYYDGNNMSVEQLNETIGKEVAGDVVPSGPVSGGSLTLNPDGSITSDTVTVTQGENASVSTSEKVVINTEGEEISLGDPSVDINVTVNGSDGWQEASGMLQDSLNGVEDRYSGGESVVRPSVSVDVKHDNTLDPTFVESMAGRDVILNVTTQNGSSWLIDCSKVGLGESEGIYDLSYTIEKGSEELCEELGTSACFVLRFSAAAEVNAELLIRLGETWARQNATLFCRDDGELVRHQTVVADGEGIAHLYLASVSDESEYYIAMNLPVPEDNAIIPDALLAEYGADAVRYEPIEYEITGRTSSWGMNINQVTWIMVGAIVAVVLVVGVTMFVLNKRKLKMGYVPDLDYEDVE